MMKHGTHAAVMENKFSSVVEIWILDSLASLAKTLLTWTHQTRLQPHVGLGNPEEGKRKYIQDDNGSFSK